MLVNRLRENGYNATYVRPIFILVNKFQERVIKVISPRRFRTVKLNSKKVRKISVNLAKLVLGLLGYLYALTSYIFIKIMSMSKIVVCDRFFYQFFFDLFDNSSDVIIRLFPKPDITFYLDCNPNTIFTRMDKHDISIDKKYYVNVINFYRRISKKYNFIVIQADFDKDTINDIMFKYLENYMFKSLNKYGGCV